MIGALDLIGVVLLGLVVAMASAIATGSSLLIGQRWLSTLGLSESPTPRDVALIASLAAAALVGKSFMSFFLTRRTFRFLANRQAMLASLLAETLLTRPLLEVQRRASQETSYALTTGVNAVTLGIVGQAVVGVSEIVVMSVLVLGLFLIDALVTILVIAFFGILGLVLARLIGRWALRLGVAQSKVEVSSVASVQHALKSYRETTVGARRGLFIQRFQALRWQAARVQADMFILYQISKYVFEVALVLGAGLLVLAVATTRDLTTALVLLTIFLAASSRLFPSLLRVQSSVVGVRNATGIAQPTFVLMDDLKFTSMDDDWSERTVVEAPDIRGGYEGFVGSIHAIGVSVTYPETTRAALTDVAIDILPGQTTALVGATGSGKSTLADVLLGVLEADSGTVVLSGLSPREAVERWSGAIAYVPQDVAVLTGTVRENVALGIPDAAVDDALAWEALERAHLAEFLRDRRESLDTVVGEDGVQLSGGQRQRLGIARALYTRPRLLVLDEATSALDAETERSISETMRELAGDVTLVVIAHRLATIRFAEQVAYLEDGRIVARGTFTEVREAIPDFDRQAKLLGL